MSFTPNLPATGQSLGFTKTPIKDNFAVIRSTIATNHYDVNDPLAGKHKFSVYPSQGTDPVTTTTEAAIYTKTLGQVNAVFRSQDSAGAGGKVYQLTRAIDGSFASFGTNNAYGTPPATFTQTGGWTFLPGGLLLQYGFYGKAGSLGSSGTIQFPIPFTNPPFSTVASLKRSSSGNQAYSISSTPTTTQFQFLSESSGSDGIYWYAVGV